MLGPELQISKTSSRLAQADLREWQKEDPSLERAGELASRNPVEESGDRVRFVYQDGLLYQLWMPAGTDQGDVRSCEQLVLPQKCCKVVLRLAHDIPLAGHLSISKTRALVLQRYYWPGVTTTAVPVRCASGTSPDVLRRQRW